MEESDEIRIMRHMAWERVKGELNAVLATYCNNEGGFDEMKKATEDFIKHVEDEGLHE